MFDTEYFRNTLQGDVDATGKSSAVELTLRTGRTLRLRSVLAIQPGWVTLEAFLPRTDDSSRTPRWMEEAQAGRPMATQRVVVAYEEIVAVAISDPQAADSPKVGFNAR